MNRQEQKIYVGIDVSKHHLDVYINSTKQLVKVTNDQIGIQELTTILSKQQPITLIVLEATGGYERLVARTLAEAKFPMRIMNPRQVRDFAKALGQLAKTDQVDCRILALFAEKVEPAARPLRTQEQQDLVDLKGRRQQLVDMITMEKNRL